MLIFGQTGKQIISYELVFNLLLLFFKHFSEGSLQPGCYTLLCSHSRSFEYYAETVYRGNERNFMAVRCSDLQAYENGDCEGKPVPMGMGTPTYAKGDFFLKTRMIPPFGTKSMFLNIAANVTPITVDIHN